MGNKQPEARRTAAEAQPPPQVLPWRGSDDTLLERVQLGGSAAAGLLYERFSADVGRMVWRLLGADADHEDLVAEVFVRVLEGIDRVRDAKALRGWVLSIAVFTVRSELRKRSVRRRFLATTTEDPAPLATVSSDDHEGRALLRSALEVLQQVPVDERLAFTLRYVDGRSLPESAQLCGCSLATIKRRIKKAEKRFATLARRYPALVERLRSAGQWGEVS